MVFGGVTKSSSRCNRSRISLINSIAVLVIASAFTAGEATLVISTPEEVTTGDMIVVFGFEVKKVKAPMQEQYYQCLTRRTFDGITIRRLKRILICWEYL